MPLIDEIIKKSSEIDNDLNEKIKSIFKKKA
jgi:hypothetical protein